MHCLYIVTEFIYRHAPAPGILTLVLAVVAAAVSTPMVVDRIKGSWWGHAVLFMILGSIAALEIMVIRHADEVSEHRITKLHEQVVQAVTNTTEIQKTLTGYINSQKIYEQSQFEKGQKHKISDELIQLKGTTANLASEIFRFLLDRNSMAPPPPRPSTWEHDIARSVPFDEQTVLFYEQRYGAKVRAVVDDLNKHGLKDERLEMIARDPHNITGIRIVANHLALQAERIAPDGIRPQIEQILMD